MRSRTQRLSEVAVSAILLSTLAGVANADCMRHVYNRSAYVLVGVQDGGEAFTIRPGSSRTVRYSAPGTLDLSAYCDAGGRMGDPAALGAPVAQRSFSYNAVLDRCAFELGYGFFEPELGVGFLPRRGTQPFTLNNPKQGDVVLAAGAAECSPGGR